jgi:hypothetical protein
MALTNFKNNAPQESGFDEMQRLMCSVPGCPNRWSVKIDRPMCSFHQWGTTAKPKSDIHSVLKTKPVQHWNDPEQDEGVF